MRAALSGLLVLMLGGCGGSGGHAGDPPDGGTGTEPIAGLQSIEITPASATLTITDGKPVTQDYHARGTFTDGHTEDITGRVGFTVSDPGVGTFADARFTSYGDHGGTTTVVAQAGGALGQTPLTVVIQQRTRDAASQLPADPAQPLAGPADPSRAPSIVYPNDGVLVPPNLGRLEVHFVPGPGNTLFEIGFTNRATDLKVYARCTEPMTGGCIFTPDATLWQRLSATNRGRDTVQITVRGTDDQGTGVGTSKPINLMVSADDLVGGLYYWTTSNGTGIMRYDFAGEQTAAERFAGPELTGGTCIGCHALSRDGTKLIVEAGGQNDGRILLLDVASGKPKVPLTGTGRSTFESWDPTGARFVGVYGDQGSTDWNLQLFDGDTAQPLGPIADTGTQAHPATHPDWSPDGRHIAYTRVGQPNTLQRMTLGSIALVDANGAGWSRPVEIVPSQAGKNRYYPAFAPDSGFLVFDESTCAPGGGGDDCDADTDPTARLFAVLAQPGAPTVELAKANAPGLLDDSTALTNSFPKFSPFIFRRQAGGSAASERDSQLMWVTFSSSRRFGLRPPPPSSTGQTPTGSLIWMSAIDPDQVGLGVDPSYPAFALPFQDLTTSNHIAQWTTQVVPAIQ